MSVRITEWTRIGRLHHEIAARTTFTRAQERASQACSRNAIFLTRSRRTRLQSGPPGINVTDFGAIADGSTDNTDAFQRSLTEPTRRVVDSHAGPGKYLFRACGTCQALGMPTDFVAYLRFCPVIRMNTDCLPRWCTILHNPVAGALIEPCARTTNLIAANNDLFSSLD